MQIVSRSFCMVMEFGGIGKTPNKNGQEAGANGLLRVQFDNFMHTENSYQF